MGNNPSLAAAPPATWRNRWSNTGKKNIYIVFVPANVVAVTPSGHQGALHLFTPRWFHLNMNYFPSDELQL